MCIKKEYPLHYEQLNETPLFLSSSDGDTQFQDLLEYLETIVDQLDSFRSNGTTLSVI
jgi:hypothetical protein